MRLRRSQPLAERLPLATDYWPYYWPPTSGLRRLAAYNSRTLMSFLGRGGIAASRSGLFSVRLCSCTSARRLLATVCSAELANDFGVHALRRLLGGSAADATCMRSGVQRDDAPWTWSTPTSRHGRDLTLKLVEQAEKAELARFKEMGVYEYAFSDAAMQDSSGKMVNVKRVRVNKG